MPTPPPGVYSPRLLTVVIGYGSHVDVVAAARVDDPLRLEVETTLGDGHRVQVLTVSVRVRQVLHLGGWSSASELVREWVGE